MLHLLLRFGQTFKLEQTKNGGKISNWHTMTNPTLCLLFRWIVSFISLPIAPHGLSVAHRAPTEKNNE